jgi:ABC-type branched-subunit amino acid transport system substrate-binding protein
MAVIEQSAAPVQLVVKDDLGTAAGAKAAADEAVREGAELILGPLFASSVEAVGPIVRAAGVPVIAFSNDRRVGGNGTYLLSFLAEQEAQRIGRYAVAQGKRRVAILATDDTYGKVTTAAFRAAVTEAGGEIVAAEIYDPAANRSIDAVQKIAAAIADWGLRGEPIDALFIPAAADSLVSLAPQLAYAKIDVNRVKLLGTGGWDSPSLGQHTALVGAWFPAPDPRGWRDFSERFGRTFGQPAPRIATLAYDALGIALALADSKVPAVGGRSRFTSVDIARANGFSGVDGPVRLLADGTAERGLAVLEVQKFGAAVVEPAPTGFIPERVAATGQRLN